MPGETYVCPEIYVCPYCGFVTTHYPYLFRHVKEEHGRLFCPVCGKKVRKRLTKHAYQCYFRGKTMPEEHLVLWLLLCRRPTRKLKKVMR